MSIRKNNKDNLKRNATPLVAVPNALELLQSDNTNPLEFWTKHKSPQFMDLTVFRDGEQTAPPGRGSKLWLGPFSGRPELIAQLAPAIRELCEFAAPSTASQFRYTLRAWWRILDAVESSEDAPIHLRARTVIDITDVHRLRAFESGMSSGVFMQFVRLLNTVRLALKLRQLYWDPPADSTISRKLPPQWQTDQIRFYLKRNWFETLARWDRAAELITNSAAINAAEGRLAQNYNRFLDAVNRTGLPRPPAQAIWNELSPWNFGERGFSVSDMLNGFYPNSFDIRVAFHLCLASTGWNPSTLLGLDVNTNFIQPHPKDSKRYLMRGYKPRSGTTQVTEGLAKSRGSAGGIIRILISRTEPLRKQLRANLDTLRTQLRELNSTGAPLVELNKLRKEIVRLEQGVASPWLYVTSAKDAIVWLEQTKSLHSRGLRGGRNSFLDDVISEVNLSQPPDRQLSKFRASDFRDAFAAYAYRISGGMVYYVMKVLGHKYPTSTQRYLDNTLLNAESNRLYQTFANSLWSEIRTHGRVDPTIIAKWSRDGSVTEEERSRLQDYRQLTRSRLGIGCKDPTNPPKHIDPTFKKDGKKMCSVQRCTLCVENAVIFPESISGLCKRLAELYHIKSGMSTVSFLESSFVEEMKNTETALECFDKNDVKILLKQWQTKIATGEHRVIAFE